MFRAVRIGLACLGVSALLLTACGSDGGSDIPDHCNPLGGEACLMPWPSSAYLTAADTQTGFRLDVPFDAMPQNIDGITVDPAPFARMDGFAPSGVIVAMFPEGVDAAGLPPHTNPGASLQPDSPVVIINMETGQRVMLFAEVDMNFSKPEDRALIIHPLERMQPGTRHLVAVRKTVKGPGGVDLTMSPAFQALVEGKSYDHPMMEKLEPLYPAIFQALEADGISKDELLLAWDFVTASQDMLTSDLRSMRSQAETAMGDAGANLTYTITSDELNFNNKVHRFISGTHTSPNFLTDKERDRSIIKRGADNLPQMDGMYDANFSAIVPKCIETATLPVPVMIFGHGLFGSAEEYADDNFLQDIANDYCFVVIAGDWIGLTNRQLAAVAFAMNDVNRGTGITEKLAQAVINFISLENITRGGFLTADEFKYNGQQIIDPTQLYYLGGSLGGIMGNVFMAYDKQITRGALGVPGGAWSLMFERSTAWGPLQGAVLGAYPERGQYQLIVSLLGLAFEPYDAITTAYQVVNDPLPDTPAKQILMYSAIGDALVWNMSTEMVARTMQIELIGPSLRIPYGFTEKMEPATSALTIYDEKPDPLPPTTNVPPFEDNGTHSDINKRPAVLRQVHKFVLEGQIVNTCLVNDVPSVCDCTTGACD